MLHLVMISLRRNYDLLLTLSSLAFFFSLFYNNGVNAKRLNKNSLQERGPRLFLPAIILVAGIYLYKTFLLPESAGYILRLVMDILVLGLMALALVGARRQLLPKFEKPLRLMRHVLGLSFLLFILSGLSGWEVWGDVNEQWGKYLGNWFFLSLTLLVIVGLMTLLTIFLQLAVLRQKHPPKKSIRIMLLLMVVTYFAAGIGEDMTWEFISYGPAGLLVLYHSFKIAWIAFLTKKEKIWMLVGLLFTLGFLSGPITAVSIAEHSFQDLLTGLSPGLPALCRVILHYGALYCVVVFFTTLFHLPTTEVFQRKRTEADSLRVLNHLLAKMPDFDELSAAVTRMTAEVCHTDSAWLVTANDGDTGGVKIISTDRIETGTAEKVTRALLDSRDIDQRTPTMFHQEELAPLLAPLKGVPKLKTVVIAPLVARDKPTGYLFAGCKQKMGFDKDDQEIIGAFANQAAVGLERAKHLEERLEKERMQKELEVAREIQEKILPQELPQLDSIQLAAHFTPASEVGGDYYDFFQIAPGKLALVVADVSGKGVSASLIMAEVKGIFESLCCILESPAQMLTRVNEILKKSLGKNRFVTLIYGVVDIETHTLRFARAGHPPLLHYHAETGSIDHVQPRGVGLGLVAGPVFAKGIEEVEVHLGPGDVAVLYTDGISEAKNDTMEDFGPRRLEEVVRAHPGADAAQLGRAIIDSAAAFSGSQPQHDDITLVVLKRIKE